MLVAFVMDAFFFFKVKDWPQQDVMENSNAIYCQNFRIEFLKWSKKKKMLEDMFYNYYNIS